ncbi:WD40 repeat-like protein [Dendrothele bispora CBS 962.96]|uniref:WD40 repeat-like protein n=1 Tax=Dendrothele bispora (strain CBS 962.96) TaxID=1314807 RepID=A0A4V4HH69_DENBC|nr:WD40 repeat-like protein [Dendrothele bispora CBS 962.96]
MTRIQITSDEINRLIYSYFKDSGFEHSAFALAKEAHLERSPCFSKHVPRGELVELLSKSLLYTEVEYHFQGGELAANCKTGFSLLETHVCSLTPPEPQTFIAPVVRPNTSSIMLDTTLPIRSNGVPDVHSSKRKAEAPLAEPQEKRSRREAEMQLSNLNDESSTRKPRNAVQVPRKQGPLDENTDPNSINLLYGHRTEVFCCAFNPAKHSLVASGSKDASVKIWNLVQPLASSSKDPVTIELSSSHEAPDLTCLSWNKSGELLAVASYDSILRICDLQGKIYFQHNKHQGPIFTTRFSPSGRWLLTASLDGTSCLWDVANKRLHKQYRVHTDCCLDVDWINDTTFASCGADKFIHILSVDQENPIKTFSGHKDEINQIKVNPTGTRLASCSDDTTTRIWDVSNISNQADAIPGLDASANAILLEGHTHSVSTLGWYKLPGTSKELLATGSFDGATRLWDTITGECLHTFSDHVRPVYALSISPNNCWMATGGGDGWLFVYSLKTKTKIWSWFAGEEKPGVFEIDWQSYEDEKIERLALALECKSLGLIDVSLIPAIRDSI